MSGKVFHAPFIHQHEGFELTGIVERTKNDEAEIFDILGATCVRCFKCGYDNSDVYDVIDTEKRTGGGKSSPYKRGGGKIHGQAGVGFKDV